MVSLRQSREKYLVNESLMNVYFDDFQVTHSAGKVLEESIYEIIE